MLDSLVSETLRHHNAIDARSLHKIFFHLILNAANMQMYVCTKIFRIHFPLCVCVCVFACTLFAEQTCLH